MAPRCCEDKYIFVYRKSTNKTSIHRTSKLSSKHVQDSTHHNRSSSQKEESPHLSTASVLNNIHYPFKHKDLVCQCSDKAHFARRSVHNFEVRALCAEYFRCNPDKTLCSREDWRATFKGLILAKQTQSAATNVSRKVVSDAFEYDRQSMLEFLRNPKAEDRSSCTSSSKSSKKSRKSTLCLRNGPSGELDIPKPVWQEARPSVYSERNDLDSTVSTPLGTVFSPYLYDSCHSPIKEAFLPAPLNIMRRIDKPASLPFDKSDSLFPGISAPLFSGMANNQVACSSVYPGDYKSPEYSTHLPTLCVNSTTHYNTVYRAPGSVQFDNECKAVTSTVGDAATPFEYSSELAGTSIPELPAPNVAAELQTAPRCVPSYHSATLRELEGDNRGRLLR